MKILKGPIALNEATYNVTLLHKALTALGMPVSEKETARNLAGPDTFAKVRELQAKLNMPVDGRDVIGELMLAAIEALMNKSGLFEASRSFTVSGMVHLPDGSGKAKQKLLAFDLDLRGVGVYRETKTLAEMDKSGGFEYLGEVHSTTGGVYSLTFYDWQYRRAERKKADVVIFAVDAAQAGEQIVGRSRIVAAEDYSDVGLVFDLDVWIGVKPERTEYQALMEPLGSFLKESEIQFIDIANSADQLAFTARELDIDFDHLLIAAQAEVLAKKIPARISHEFMYGIGRQEIGLSWPILHKTRKEDLSAAISRSTANGIIREISEKDTADLINLLHKSATASTLSTNRPFFAVTIDKVLSVPLPNELERTAFVDAAKNFAGSGNREFWTKYLPEQPEFRGKPELVSQLLFTNQLTMLSEGYQPLVTELQGNLGIKSTDGLFDLEHKDWLAAVKKAGVPDGTPGEDANSKAENYVARLRGLLDSAFPTKRIVKMVEKGQLPIGDKKVLVGLRQFISNNPSFDFATSRVHDLKAEIETAAGTDAAEVSVELMKLQRVFQVSPSPTAMTALLNNKLDSAYAINSIPLQSFIHTYGDALGGEAEAFQVHQRASHIATKSELAAMHLLEYSDVNAPVFAMAPSDRETVIAQLKQRLPNYSELFGRPDMCECKACRSVYSPAAYLVELLRFLWRGMPNSDGKSPLEMLRKRRPDLFTLPLTCENSNTVIPYIDLANEIMEYYTATDSIENFAGFDTGDATAEELRANPQNLNLEAYRVLKDATYPFTLPYHQPLDVIRTFSDQLSASRYEAMKAVNPTPDPTTARAIAAESLELSQEEYSVLTGENFDESRRATAVFEYFGYTNASELENLKAVPELLRRSGLKYTDLVELVKTQFINPSQATLAYLQQILAMSTLDAPTFYARLKQIEAETLDPDADVEIKAAIEAYNTTNESSITPAEFGQRVANQLKEFRKVITLYEPNSTCDLSTTELRTLGSIYEALSISGIEESTWSKLHRFIRLWRKLGWTIHETDLMLAALGENDITDQTIAKLESVKVLKDASRLPVDQLASAWGLIDTYGEKALYRKLFLSKAARPIDPAFQPNAWGEYLQSNEPLVNHRPAILAALRLREDELSAILGVARIIDDAGARHIDTRSDKLDLANLSTIYRYATFARALKMRVTDLCDLISHFGGGPFSTWSVVEKKFVNISPSDTNTFFQLAASVKDSGFKVATLGYIFHGTLPANSTQGLKPEKVRQTARAIRDLFAAIEAVHPDTFPSPLGADIITAKLTLTFQPDVVARFMAILADTASFEVLTEKNLGIVIPSELSSKFSYVKGSGRLTSAGVMTDAELAILRDLAQDAEFQKSVDDLYAAPELFIAENFGGIFPNIVEATAKLLEPVQTRATALEEKYQFVYRAFVPVLRAKLRREAVTQKIGALIGLTDAATELLIAADIEKLAAALSTEGFSATYFSDTGWTNPVTSRADATIDFEWKPDTQDPAVTTDQFSVTWEAHLAAPASGDYTFIVDVAEQDETFTLYLDDAELLKKIPTERTLSKETPVVSLNASQMPRLRLKYAETAHDAGIHLKWKTATSAASLVPASAAYPADELDGFIVSASIYDRAAKFITGFALSETELDWLIRARANFGNIDFKALTPAHWKSIRAYTTLRDAVPQAQALLTDVFAAAAASSPAPKLDDVIALFLKASAWESASLRYLVDAFHLQVDNFTNEVWPNRLLGIMKIAAKTGLSAETISRWGEVEVDFDKLDEVAQLIKNTVKSKYQDEDWLGVAASLSDKIRDRQKQALGQYLLTLPAVREWGAEDLNGLFEYFLIDVQMGTCMDTSRIVQAHAAVQMFVSRCLLNLESNIVNGAERGVSPGAIVARERWDWLKNYRVWEANRKVFLYPENWLEPEWRNDRSEFFKELESYLLQNDITDRSVEQGFRSYLASLNQVANLDICGTCRENYTDGSPKFIHVFGRTHTAPYKYYYRRWNKSGKWSAWERVPVDIRPVETAGVKDTDNSGVHLIPVFWKGRLFLFTPEFMHVQEPASGGRNKSIEATASESTISQLEGRDILQVKLAWSEYVEGKWTPKRVTKEYVRLAPKSDNPAIEKDYLFTASTETNFITGIDLTSAVAPGLNTNRKTQELTITISDTWRSNRGSFVFSDIESPVRVNERDFRRVDPEMLFDRVEVEVPRNVVVSPPSAYVYYFSKRRASTALRLQGDQYFSTRIDHKLLPLDSMTGLDLSLSDPFFFSDQDQTYFARPLDISVVESIRNPIIIPPDLIIRDFEPRPGPRPPMPGPRNLVAVASGAGSADSPVNVRASIVNRRYLTELAVVNKAFGGQWTQVSRPGKGLEFHTFHHPFSSRYVELLNQFGLAGLMDGDTTIPSDEGRGFENRYGPNFTFGFVQKPGDFPNRTYYKDNVCFDARGANSIFNQELFFSAPLYIATRLSKNGRYEEALKWFHFIFDPMSDEMPAPGEPDNARYWKFKPFKTEPAVSLEDWFRTLSPTTSLSQPENDLIREWRENPFQPHVVASNRPLAYMKHVVIKYVENLVAWGDSKLRQFTRESVNEALQLYVIAKHILGPEPELVPSRGEIKAETYSSLENKWDDFSNALVELENLFPYSGETSVVASSTGPSLLGVGSALYFGIPANDKLIGHWRTVDDRLYKIRNCQDIYGVQRRLDLFAPPIDPAALIQAVSQGMSLGSILADLNSPPPLYRFSVLLQKANEFCGDVKALGGSLLAALEKKDAEELGRLRASHESQMLELMTAIKERQVLEARANREGLEKSRTSAAFRLRHYSDLLGNDGPQDPGTPTLAPVLTAESQLPGDTAIAIIKTNVDEALVEGEESGIKLINKERHELDKINEARNWQIAAQAMETLASIAHIIPTVGAVGTPLGVGADVKWGGTQLGNALSATGKIFDFVAGFSSHEASLATKAAGYIRREQDWTLQANLAAKEMIQLDKQITSAAIRIQVAEAELANHKQQIENTKTAELFLQNKFTNQELYQWMKEQLFAVYKQSYNLAFDMAKKAERAYQLELGTETTSFIQYGYWDNSTQGLAAGEKLQLALRQLEKSYLEDNRRELELTKNISLARLDPPALIRLRETGQCNVQVPEELFDMDFRGHYFRRLKSVRLTIPCVTGPYTSVNCTLRLLNNTIRTNTAMSSANLYEHENDAGQWIDDPRFRTSYAPVQSIATSSAQNDAGVFEFNFRDERYLPFELAGAISDWQLELSTEKEMWQFDQSKITDVVLHFSYTAREQGGLFKETATTYITEFIKKTANAAEEPFMHLFSMRQEFSSEWSRFINPAVEGEQILTFTIGRDRLPFFVQNRTVVVSKIELFAKGDTRVDYDLIMSYQDSSGEKTDSSEIKIASGSGFGDVQQLTLPTTDGGLDLEKLDITKPISLAIKGPVAADSDILNDLFVVLHYKLANP